MITKKYAGKLLGRMRSSSYYNDLSCEVMQI